MDSDYLTCSYRAVLHMEDQLLNSQDELNKQRGMNYQEWFNSRPPQVQKLALEFPAGTTFDVKGVKHWVLGFTGNDYLLLSPIDPNEDYEGAYEAKIFACASHFRN